MCDHLISHLSVSSGHEGVITRNVIKLEVVLQKCGNRQLANKGGFRQSIAAHYRSYSKSTQMSQIRNTLWNTEKGKRYKYTMYNGAILLHKRESVTLTQTM